MNLFVIAVLFLFAINVLFGLLIGLIRGKRKALVRLITLAVAFILALLLTPLFAKIAASYGVDAINGMLEGQAMAEIISSEMDVFSKLALMLIKPIFFIIVFIVFWLISLIAFWILSAIFVKKRDEYGVKLQKGRLLGLVIGAACGFIMFLVVFVPINGYLSVVSKINVTIDEKPILSEMTEQEVAGFTFDIVEYDESFASGLGLGIDKLCFNYLASTKINDQKIVLSKEADVLADVIEKYNLINTEDILGDVPAFENLVNVALESKLVIATKDYAIDYIIENPDVLGLDENGEGGEQSLFSSEMVVDILKELKGDIKAQIGLCFEAFYVIADLNISLTALDMNVIAELDDTKVNRLVDTLLDVSVVRVALPYLITDLIKPVTESMGSSMQITKPVLTDSDWQNEKTHLVAIFKDFGILTDLVNLQGSGEGGLDSMENYFVKENAVAIGRLMESLRSSKLLGQTYDAMFAFDTEKKEYFFISKINDIIFSSIDTGEGSPKTLRPLFVEYGGSKTGGVAPEDTISFDNFRWQGFFGDVSDMFSFMKNVKALEGKDLSTANSGEIKDLIENLGNMNTEVIKDVLDAIIPENSGIVVPDMNGVDFTKEAEVYEELSDFQTTYNERKEEGGNMTQQEVDDIAKKLNESDFIVKVLDSSNTTVNVSEEEKQMVENAINNPENNIDDAKKEMIKKLFGLSLGGDE